MLNKPHNRQFFFIPLFFMIIVSIIQTSAWADDKLPAPTGFTYVKYVALDDGYESYNFKWNPVEGAQGYSISWEAVDDPYDYSGEYIIGGNSTTGSICSTYNVYSSGNIGPGHRLTVGKTYIIKVRAWTRTESLASHIGSTYHYNYTYGDYCDPIYVTAGVKPVSENASSEDNSKADKPDAGTETPSSVNNNTIGAFSYTVKNGSATIISSGNKKAVKLTIPATVSINGKSLPVTSIAPNAFAGMKNLTSIVIGKNVKSIGKNAFKGCSKLKKITIKTIKLTKKTIGANAFKGIHKKAVVKCPKAKKATYKKILLKKGMKKTMTFK